MVMDGNYTFGGHHVAVYIRVGTIKLHIGNLYNVKNRCYLSQKKRKKGKGTGRSRRSSSREACERMEWDVLFKGKTRGVGSWGKRLAASVRVRGRWVWILVSESACDLR